MKVWGLTFEQIHRALMVVNHKYGNNLQFDRTPERVGLAFNFRLTARSARATIRREHGEKVRYYPIGCRVREDQFSGNTRGVATACWHAFRDFAYACYGENPDARIKTAFADYRGLSGFEQTYPDTAMENIGSQFYPQYFGSTCACPDGNHFSVEDML